MKIALAIMFLLPWLLVEAPPCANARHLDPETSVTFSVVGDGEPGTLLATQIL